MENENIEQLVQEIKKEYSRLYENLKDESTGGSLISSGMFKAYEDVITKINRIYNTNYSLSFYQLEEKCQ